MLKTNIRFRQVMAIMAAYGFAISPGPGGAQAQQAAQQPAVKEIVKATHGDWQVRCQNIKVPNQQGGKAKKDELEEIEQCGMVQVIADANDKNIRINVAVLKGRREGKVQNEMRVVAPLGVFLPTGIAFEIDGKPIGRTGFVQCQRNGCLAIVEVDDTLLGKLKKGAKGNFIIYRGPGIGIGMGLSLKGFSKAYDIL